MGGDPVNFTDPIGLAFLGEIIDQVITNGLLDSNAASNEVQNTLDDMRNNNIPNTADDRNGAIRHCTWMCRTTIVTDPNTAKSIGVVHEKHGKPGPSSQMDLHNNSCGISIGQNLNNGNQCIGACINAANQGTLQTSP